MSKAKNITITREEYKELIKESVRLNCIIDFVISHLATTNKNDEVISDEELKDFVEQIEID